MDSANTQSPTLFESTVMKNEINKMTFIFEIEKNLVHSSVHLSSFLDRRLIKVNEEPPGPLKIFCGLIFVESFTGSGPELNF